jgi:phage nucleotide-binding protein
MNDGGRVGALDFGQMKVLVFDHLTELKRFLELALMRFRKKRFVELKEYGDSAQKMREYLRDLRSLKNRGVVVICFAHDMQLEYTESSGATLTKWVPDVGRTYVNEVLGLFDVVGRLDWDDEQKVRRIQIKPTWDVAAKCRWTEIYTQHGEYFPADLGLLLHEVYKIRRNRRKQTGPKSTAPDQTTKAQN